MDTAKAYVWRLQNFVLGEHILNPCPENRTPVKAPDIGSDVPSPHEILGSSGGSKTP
ncbi:U3 small nucleolar RNA-associated protein 21 [Vigna unguiculata]|uniref:U3 small nucleolar RNA-associated protein 21 n=1 Tax=Vigna unguiculata TaxID=3917 RepID=A0A4D6LGG7_VIGUN|nr:U3 small nucleolar RNA-associated protein 21 [Vigna unguiculata]